MRCEGSSTRFIKWEDVRLTVSRKRVEKQIAELQDKSDKLRMEVSAFDP